MSICVTYIALVWWKICGMFHHFFPIVFSSLRDLYFRFMSSFTAVWTAPKLLLIVINYRIFLYEFMLFVLWLSILDSLYCLTHNFNSGHPLDTRSGSTESRHPYLSKKSRNEGFRIRLMGHSLLRIWPKFQPCLPHLSSASLTWRPSEPMANGWHMVSLVTLGIRNQTAASLGISRGVTGSQRK